MLSQIKNQLLNIDIHENIFDKSLTSTTARRSYIIMNIYNAALL